MRRFLDINRRQGPHHLPIDVVHARTAARTNAAPRLVPAQPRGPVDEPEAAQHGRVPRSPPRSE